MLEIGNLDKSGREDREGKIDRWRIDGEEPRYLQYLLSSAVLGRH